MDHSASELGSTLKTLREAKGLTLRDVEEKTKISNPFLSQLESGKVRQPSPIALFKLAALYEGSYEELMKQAGYPVPEKAPVGHSRQAPKNRLGQLSTEEETALREYLSFIRSRARKTR